MLRINTADPREKVHATVEGISFEHTAAVLCNSGKFADLPCKTAAADVPRQAMPAPSLFTTPRGDIQSDERGCRPASTLPSWM